jgi:hypothetical protein
MKRIKDAFGVLTGKRVSYPIADDSNTVSFAKNELTTAGLFDKDSDYDGMLGDAVLELVNVFSYQGHSGFSAGMCVNIFKKVALHEPLGPLTGEDDEWNNCWDMDPDSDLFQNKRCSHVFKEGIDGTAYDINGKIFREPDGMTYTSRDSRVDAIFPYTPVSEYVDVEKTS